MRRGRRAILWFVAAATAHHLGVGVVRLAMALQASRPSVDELLQLLDDN